ncbi:MAG TPA: chemotaxis protein CheB, partial [Lacunisphaera sp.]|nr:chemotaxis protein CheB [Lacunisphaera sp.]
MVDAARPEDSEPNHSPTPRDLDHVDENAGCADEKSGFLPYHPLPVVGLGGSAGSLAPLQTFFSNMPPDSGMAFVVILHLSPEHDSMLAEILQKTTTMRVTQVRDRVTVKPNHVYVIPPGRHLSMADGHLETTQQIRTTGRRVAVDYFFRTLADTHGPSSIAVVLSGADSDGAIGIKRIKERGGLTIAQDPQESEHPGMPQSAIETRLVDWVLRADEMAARIVAYRRNGRRVQLADLTERLQDLATAEAETASNEAALRDVLSVLRTRTGRDFSCYKRG